MGHIRLGRLPKSQRWQQVVGLLSANGTVGPDPARVAAATARAARTRLGRLESDPVLGYAVWLLARLAAAARRPDFAEAAALLGLDVRADDSVVGVVAQVADRVRDEVERHPGSGPFGDLAALAQRRALLESVGSEGRSLFGGPAEDLERAFRAHATPARFGAVARRFFGDLLARTLRFYVDRELPLLVGPGSGLADLDRAEAFAADLDRHARQSARVVEQFAADWYSLRDWESGGAIGRDEAQAFVAVALGKLRAELAEAGA